MPTVTLAAAARALGLNRSTLARYLRQYPELNRAPTGAKRPKVDLDELSRHRGENVNLAMSANHRGGLAIPVEPAGEDRGPAAATPTYAEHKARKEAAAATRAELDLEERLARLVPREEVEAASQGLGETLRERLGARNRDLAERLAALDDPREVIAALDASDRELLAAFAAGLQRLADREETHADAA